LYFAVRTTFSILGWALPIGPGRAVSIALASRFAFKPKRESLHCAKVKNLKIRVAEKDFGQSYLVVRGDIGVGKSCLLNTVTNKMPGVIKVIVWPWDRVETILEKSLHQLIGTYIPYTYPFASARRVIFWHRIFTLGRPPILVINVAERELGQKCAPLVSVVRDLVENYKLRVVVEGSQNSLSQTLLRTMRQIIIDIDPMTKEMIWQLSHLKDLFKHINETKLGDIVFAVLGGIPSRYNELWYNVQYDLKNGHNVREAIGNHLCAEIFHAINIIQYSCKKTPDVAETIQLFDKKHHVDYFKAVGR
jgi:hypothetical protein